LRPPLEYVGTPGHSPGIWLRPQKSHNRTPACNPCASQHREHRADKFKRRRRIAWPLFGRENPKPLPRKTCRLRATNGAVLEIRSMVTKVSDGAERGPRGADQTPPDRLQSRAVAATRPSRPIVP
jgi:hypothetical protein